MLSDSQVAPDKVSQVGTDAPMLQNSARKTCNQELLKLAGIFRDLNDHLDRMVACEDRVEEPALLNLHREWADVCSRAAALPAFNNEARRVKAAMLMTVLDIVAPGTGTREPQETLAASLARDLLR